MAILQHFAYQAELNKLKNNNDGTQTSTNTTEKQSSSTVIVTTPSVIPSTPTIATLVTPSVASIERDYDYRTLSDPLVPPRKRDDYNIPLTIPFATRGYPASYKKMGLLVDKTADNTDPYKFMVLVGRQKYRGSDYYDYYVTEKGSEGNGALKFDLPDLHKELYSGDKVKINSLNKEYEAIIDRNVEFEYNPYAL